MILNNRNALSYPIIMFFSGARCVEVNKDRHTISGRR